MEDKIVNAQEIKLPSGRGRPSTADADYNVVTKKEKDVVSKIMQIFDVEIKGVVYFNEHTRSLDIKGTPPWLADLVAKKEDGEREKTEIRPVVNRMGLRQMTTVDFQLFTSWFGLKYGYGVKEKLENHLYAYAYANNRYHPIKDLVESVKWDGVKRAETVFIDSLGVEDTPEVREITRKTLLACMYRLYEPGTKWDYMTILAGRQGCGKSTLLYRLSLGSFDDSIRNFDSKEAGEHLQGVWIVEISELSAYKKSEIEEVKAFITKTSDRYRMPYDRTVRDHARTAVLFGTTNDSSFLNDPTGNRRFNILTCVPENAKFAPWEIDDDYFLQLWAEVRTWYRERESIVMGQSVIKYLEEARREYTYEPPYIERLILYLNMSVDHDYWYSLSPRERAEHFERYLGGEQVEGDLRPRTRVSISEIMDEAFTVDYKKAMQQQGDAITPYKISRILSTHSEISKQWKKTGERQCLPHYGRVRLYRRVDIEDTEDTPAGKGAAGSLEPLFYMVNSPQ